MYLNYSKKQRWHHVKSTVILNRVHGFDFCLFFSKVKKKTNVLSVKQFLQFQKLCTIHECVRKNESFTCFFFSFDTFYRHPILRSIAYQNHAQWVLPI